MHSELRELIRRIRLENLLWRAPRIHGELLKLGFEVAQSTVAKYMGKRHRPPGQRWRTFLRNHAPEIGAMDLFVVPTIRFDLLYAFIIVRLHRRELVWINVTSHPTAEWIARQISEAFPWNEAPRDLIRDRDGVFGLIVKRRLRAMGIRDKPIAPASPWQNSYAERLIGSIRRECLDHLIVLGESHLRRILRSYGRYYNEARTHRSLGKDAPHFREVQRVGAFRSEPVLVDFITIMSESSFRHTHRKADRGEDGTQEHHCPLAASMGPELLRPKSLNRADQRMCCPRIVGQEPKSSLCLGVPRGQPYLANPGAKSRWMTRTGRS